MDPSMTGDVATGASLVTLVALLANITVQSLKSRGEAKARQNGNGEAKKNGTGLVGLVTKVDLQISEGRLSEDIKGIYVRIDGFVEKCFERHATLERELGMRGERLDNAEKRIKDIEDK